MPRIYPDSLAAWQSTYVGEPASDVWTMQGAGPGEPNVIGTDDLVAGNGTVIFRQEGEDGRFAIEFTDSAAQLVIADTSFGDVGPNPISTWIRAFIPLTIPWSTNRGFVGKIPTSGALNRWYVPGRGASEAGETLRSAFALLVQDGTNPSQTTERCMHQSLFPGPKWIDMIVRIDLANQLMAVCVAFDNLVISNERAVDDTTVVDDFGGGSFAVGASVGSAQIDSRMSYCAKWTNHYLSDTDVLELINGGQRGPIVTNVIPASGGDLAVDFATARLTPVQFDVVDDQTPVFTEVSLKYLGSNDTLVVHDGVNFRGIFASTVSTRAAITGGWRFVVLPQGGWRSSIEELSAQAVSPAGRLIDQ